MKGIVLIGFMGAGKTTIGKLLAEKTDLAHVDLDEMIVQEIGMSIKEYFDLHGEAAFRQKETEVLERFLTLNHIVATGGGIVLKEENRAILQQMQNTVVYLKTDPDELIQRLAADQENVRPLVLSKSPEEIKEIYLPRIPFYEESADLIIDTTGKLPAEIIEEILEQAGD